jgi:hypothetical protein
MGGGTSISVESNASAASGHKKTLTPTKREMKAAEKPALSLFPHPVFGETVARASARDFDEHEKAGLLATSSSYRPRLPILSDSGILRFSSSIQRRYRTGFAPDYLFSLGHGLRALFHVNYNL